jgi:hypothetical protein
MTRRQGTCPIQDLAIAVAALEQVNELELPSLEL